MEKELKIMTATVTIQLITVDGKKMTKSVFNQIQDDNCFDKNMNFTGDSFLGYIIDSGKVLLWIKNGELRKTHLGFIERMAYLDFKEARVLDVSKICQLCNITYPDKNSQKVWSKLESYFDKEQISSLEKIKKISKDFLEKLSGNQLYIAI